MEKQLEKWEKMDAGVLNPHGVLDEMEHNDLKRKISLLEQELQLKDEAHAARIWKLKATNRKANAQVWSLREKDEAHVARISRLKAANRKANAQLWSLREKHREATNELQVVEKAFIKGLENSCTEKNLGMCDTIFPKAMGILDTEEEWSDFIFGFYTSGGEDPILPKGKEFMRYWEARVRDPNFDASIYEEDEDGNLKYTIRKDNEELNQMLENYGPEVYKAVCNAHLQVKAYGTDTVLWHYAENRKGTASEVLEVWSLSFERI